MKKVKLNKKGFTLIELLAIIVILAIIMIVTIPSVLTTISTIKGKQFVNSANIIADWTQKQYELAQIGQADEAFLDVCPANEAYCVSSTYGVNSCVDPITGNPGPCYGKPLKKYDEHGNENLQFYKYLTSAGLNPKDYSQIEIYFYDYERDGTPEKRACVVIINEKDIGVFKNLKKDGNPDLEEGKNADNTPSGYIIGRSDICP